MRKIIKVFSTLVFVAMLLVACGGQGTSTSTPATSVSTMTEQPTLETTGTAQAPSGTETMMPTEAGTGTPGIPVTGEQDPGRLSNELDYTVWNQSGDQIGEVKDLVVDLGASRVPYVLVGTGGFLDIGEKNILVPWDQLQLQTNGDNTTGQSYAFILQADQQTFENAPDVDINTILPPLGEPAGNWDADIVNYWQNGSVSSTASPATTGTAAPATTSTAIPAITVTAMPGGAMGQLQGVVLASDLIGSNVNIGPGGDVTTGTPAENMTAMPNTTNTPAANATSLSTTVVTPAGTAMTTGNQVTSANIDDVIVDINSGDVMYFVLDATGFAEGDRYIPVPPDQFSWDAANSSFALNVDQPMLENAPYFQDGQYPDTTVSGWDSDYSSYWQ